MRPFPRSCLRSSYEVRAVRGECATTQRERAAGAGHVADRLAVAIEIERTAIDGQRTPEPEAGPTAQLQDAGVHRGAAAIVVRGGEDRGTGAELSKSPAPEMTPPIEKLAERSISKMLLSVTLPRIEPDVPPLPSCNAPALMVVPPVYELIPVKVNVPAPCLVKAMEPVPF